MIRPIENSDKDLFIDLAKQFYTSHAVDHSIPLEHFERTFDECLNDSPYCHAVMVECDGKSVGFGLLAITYSNEAGGIVIWLEELYIQPEYRSRGLGKELFNYIYSTYPHAARYRLEATRSNERAISLYKHLGYQELDYIQLILDKK